jgi:hypothetical protein
VHGADVAAEPTAQDDVSAVTPVARRRPAQRASGRRGRLRRNARCHCGSGRKYKNCCLTLDEARRRSALPDALPAWLRDAPGKLYQFERYATKVYNLPGLLADFTDSRRRPRIPTFDVVNSLVHTALLRVPSLNALEGNLEEPDFQRLLGHPPHPGEKSFSAEVVANVLDQLELADGRRALEDVVWSAERNKAFRGGSYGGLRCVAIDGWEPVSSFHRHCDQCLVRKVKTKLPSGELGEREQYYHAYVVALLLGPVVDVVLGIEPVRNAPARRQAGEPEPDGAEGELTAALRLLDFLHATYGSFLDLFVLDGLYPNGPVMTRLDQYGYSALIVLKKPDHEPLKEALALWQDQPPSRSLDDEQAREHIDFWDIDGIETLDTYPGKVRVLRAEVTRLDGSPKRTWCFAAVGKKAAKLSAPTALRIQRARWHLENTAFHQWITRWHLGHVFRHTGNALLALLLLWALTFNLLQLFVYRRLGRERHPLHPTDTIRHLVELMLREVATLPAPIPWDALLDSS